MYANITEKSSDIVYFVPQFSDFQEISVHEMLFLKKVLKEAEKNNVKAVIFEIDTPGGRVDVALKYVSILAKANVKTIAFVNAQAISAGMILALAADEIAINPSGTIGDAMPLQSGPGGIKPIVVKRDEKNDKKKVSEEKIKDTSKKDLDKKPDNSEHSENKEKIKEEDKTKKQENIEDKLKNLIKNFDDFKKKHPNGNEKLSDEEKKLVKQKFLTVFFKILQVLAEKHNRPVRVIRAMADPYQKLTLKDDGIKHTEKSPLTLSAKEAKKLHVVDYICKNKEDVKIALGLRNCTTIVKDKSPVFYFIYFLANPFVSSFLIILGILGLYVEAKTPGIGFPGGLGIVCLSLFFMGHAGIGDSSWLPSIIFLFGVVLIALEIFVIPGFGVTGISGLIAIIVSLLLAFGWDNLETGINTVGVSIIIAIFFMILLTIYLPKTKVFRKITLETVHKSEDGFEAHKKCDKNLIGKLGVAHSILRPCGIVEIDGKRLDVVTEGDFIDKGDSIKVVEVSGMKIIVEKV
jgi:membrane-bound serine protease (ClpP class)